MDTDEMDSEGRAGKLRMTMSTDAVAALMCSVLRQNISIR